MSPKFRGDSNDWLDDEGNKHGPRGPKGKKAGDKPKAFVQSESEGLPWEEANAVVVEVFPNLCRVQILGTQDQVLCSYRRVGVLVGAGDSRERSPVAVGDRVQAEITGKDSGVVSGVCTRRNTLTRPAPGKTERRVNHVIAANMDVVVIVASAKEPEFSSGLVDRFLVAAEAQEIDTVIAISKVDLPHDRLWKPYEDLGYRVIEVSTRTETGLRELEVEIQGKEAVFCGHSGVGKTSLLRHFLGGEIGRVGEVSPFTGKGRHTTSTAVRYPRSEDSGWTDTPGVREFSLTQIDPKDLARYFPEFRSIECEQTGCIHMNEPGCVAKSLFRYASYRKILVSILMPDRRSPSR